MKASFECVSKQVLGTAFKDEVVLGHLSLTVVFDTIGQIDVMHVNLNTISIQRNRPKVELNYLLLSLSYKILYYSSVLLYANTSLLSG